MQISIDKNFVSIKKQKSTEKFSVSHIRKLATGERRLVVLGKERPWKHFGWSILALFFSVFSSDFLPTNIIFWAIIISLCYFTYNLYEMLSDPKKFKNREYLLYAIYFTSGSNEIYEFYSLDYKPIRDFYNNLSEAMNNQLKGVYNITIDQSTNSSDINIDKLVNKDKGAITFIEGGLRNDNLSGRYRVED